MVRSSRRLVAAVLTLVGVVSCGKHVVVQRESIQESAPDAAPKLDAGAIVCGSQVCESMDAGAGLGTAAPCCYNASCGIVFSSACIELHSEGVLDAGCAPVGTSTGCCRPDGTCGVIIDGTAFGCVDPFAFFPAATLGSCVYPGR